jgi:hypothetical protein
MFTAASEAKVIALDSSPETGNSRDWLSAWLLGQLNSGGNEGAGQSNQGFRALSSGRQQNRPFRLLSPLEPRQSRRTYFVGVKSPVGPSPGPEGTPTRRLPTRQPGGTGGQEVILIERCSGIQVGSNNDQVSVYRVTLPRASYADGSRLAETLLRRDAPWARDIFTHDARPDLVHAASRRPRSSSSGIIEGPRGDTLVIVRDSRGVQVGNRNVQRNDFRIKVGDTSVSADRIGGTRERQACIARLRQDPGDKVAAQWLAENLGQAARAELTASLAVRTRQAVGNPGILVWSGKFRRLTGRQIGGPGNRARVRVHVTVEKFDTRLLARHLKAAATRMPLRQFPSRADHGRRRSAREPRGRRNTRYRS